MTQARLSTRDRIVVAAVDLFHRQGYNATTLRQLADAANLQVGSLYNHMASKEQLLRDIMRDALLELIDHVETELDSVGDDPVARVRAFMGASIRVHALRQRQTFISNTELRGLSGLYYTEVLELRDRYQRLITDALQDASDRGLLRIDDVQLAAFGALALCQSVATWYSPSGRLELEDVVRDVPRMFGPLNDDSLISGAAAGRL